MTVINATNARKSLYKLIAEVNESPEPITIVHNNGKNAVLVSEDDWLSIQETIYLNQISGLAESILDAVNEPIVCCEKYEEDETW